MRIFFTVLVTLTSLSISGCSFLQQSGSSNDVPYTANENVYEDTINSIEPNVLEAEMTENQAVISSGLKEAFTNNVLFGVKIYINHPQDTDLTAKTIETYKKENALSYLYIVPRYAGSHIKIENMDFDESRNEFVTTDMVFESICTDDYALLVQADLPEASPQICITVSYENMTVSYIPTYDGRGDTKYPYVKDGVLLVEAPYSETTTSSYVSKQDSFETVIAQLNKDSIVKDNFFADPLENVELLKNWVTNYQEGKSGKVAILLDGLGFPSSLFIFESNGSINYTITCYQSESSDGMIKSPPPQKFESSMIIESTYNYVFGEDCMTDSNVLPITIHRRSAPVINEIDWNPTTGNLLGELTFAQAEEVAKEIIESVYAEGLFLPLYYKVTSALEIDGIPFYVVYANQDKEAIEQGNPGGKFVAVSEDGNLVFIKSTVDNRWYFVADKNEKVISPYKE